MKRYWHILCATAAAAIICAAGISNSTAQSSNDPVLPQAAVDTSMPSTTGYVIKTVGLPGDTGYDYTDLQTAIDAAAADTTNGWVIKLKAGPLSLRRWAATS